MPKIALVSYHSKADKIYPNQWVAQYKYSILNQTYKDFDIIESNYEGSGYKIFENSTFDNIKTTNFVETLNRLLDDCFFKLGYDFVYNSNVDDFFSFDRMEKQLPYLENGFDIVSSNFCLVKDNVIGTYHKFHDLDIGSNLSKNHNIIGHACVAYSKRFWENNRYVPDEQPLEDMMLWQRAIKNSRFIILEDNLLYHRLHSESVCQSLNR